MPTTSTTGPNRLFYNQAASALCPALRTLARARRGSGSGLKSLARHSTLCPKAASNLIERPHFCQIQIRCSPSSSSAKIPQPYTGGYPRSIVDWRHRAICDLKFWKCRQKRDRIRHRSTVERKGITYERRPKWPKRRVSIAKLFSQPTLRVSVRTQFFCKSTRILQEHAHRKCPVV